MSEELAAPAVHSKWFGKERLDTPPNMTRNQFKKQLKLKAWQEKKESNLRKEKKSRKEKKEGTPRKIYTEEETQIFQQLKQNRKVNEVSPNALCIYIDCDWEEEMTEKECQGISKQLQICYSKNREAKAEYKVKMRITSLKKGGLISDGLEAIRAENWLPGPTVNEIEKEQWHVGMCDWDYQEEAKQEMERRGRDMEIIYLTADSPNEISTLDNDTVYVLGGLLDHNRLKSVTFDRANTKSVKTARLPLLRYIQIQRRHILTVNHVFDILLYFQAKQDWQQSFLTCLPSRMEAKPVCEEEEQ